MAAYDAPIPDANVILMDKDSLIVNWGFSDDSGKYRLEGISPGLYALKIESMGNKTEITEINIDKDITEHLMMLEQQVLDEVVLVRPRIEARTDRVIFNVQNTALSNGDIWNALSRAPYLIDMGGQLLVKGREKPLIYINDRRVYLSAGELKQLLKSTPADAVKSIEVITAPPAKYDAEGQTIVNIVMSRNLSIGYRGHIIGNFQQGVYPKYRFSTGHFYKTDRLNLYLRYNNNIRKTYSFYRDGITFYTDNLPSGEWLSESQEDFKRNIHSFNTNIDYTISDNHSLSLSGMASFTPNGKSYIHSYTEAYNDLQQIDSSFYSINRERYITDNISVSLDYKYDMGEGRKLTANFNHTTYGYDHDQNVTTEYSDAVYNLIRNNAFTNDREQSVAIYAAQADYKDSNFETGIKSTYITFDNRIDQNNITGNNPELSDLFLYDETNFAAYLDYEKNWERWGIKFGVRGENTTIKARSVSTGTDNDQDYFKVFPSAYLRYDPSDDHGFSFSYNKKISRPRFDELNPFRQFFNDNNYSTGNPDLLPAIRHKYNFNYNFKQSLIFNIYHIRARNTIYHLPYVDNENNSLVYTDANIDKNTEYGINGLWSEVLTPWWELSIYSSLYYNENDFFTFQNDNETLKNGSWVTFCRINNYFTLSKDQTFTGDIGFLYLSRAIRGNVTNGKQSSLNLGLQKTFWNDRATLYFNATDIFNQVAYDSETRYLDQEISSFTDTEYRRFELGFTYRFGNYRLRTNSKSINTEERKRLD